MNLADFDFDLAEELIAQQPLPERSGGRLLVLPEASEASSHRKVCLLYTSPSPRDLSTSRMPSSA